MNIGTNLYILRASIATAQDTGCPEYVNPWEKEPDKKEIREKKHKMQKERNNKEKGTDIPSLLL